MLRARDDEKQVLAPAGVAVPACAPASHRRRVAANCFIDVDTVRYSVPHQFVRDRVEEQTRRARDPHLPRRRVGQSDRTTDARPWLEPPTPFVAVVRSGLNSSPTKRDRFFQSPLFAKRSPARDQLLAACIKCLCRTCSKMCPRRLLSSMSCCVTFPYFANAVAGRSRLLYLIRTVRSHYLQLDIALAGS
jgi:hypothetical protein